MKPTALWIMLAVACAQPDPSSAQAALTAPPLPEGRLLFVTRGQAGAIFIANPTERRRGEVVETLALEIYDIPITLARGALVQRVTRQRLDCAKRTRQVLGSAGYDAEGKLVVSSPEEPAASIQGYSGYDVIAAVVCDGDTPPGNVVMDSSVQAARWSRDRLMKKQNR